MEDPTLPRSPRSYGARQPDQDTPFHSSHLAPSSPPIHSDRDPSYPAFPHKRPRLPWLPHPQPHSPSIQPTSNEPCQYHTSERILHSCLYSSRAPSPMRPIVLLQLPNMEGLEADRSTPYTSFNRLRVSNIQFSFGISVHLVQSLGISPPSSGRPSALPPLPNVLFTKSNPLVSL